MNLWTAHVEDYMLQGQGKQHGSNHMLLVSARSCALSIFTQLFAYQNPSSRRFALRGASDCQMYSQDF